jgi:Na+/proline symporter
MSDIGILNSPLSVALVLLLFGSPGLPLGAIAGALAWRKHRVWGALLGAVAGFGLWLLGWLYFSNNL